MKTCRRVEVIFMPQSLYPWGKNSQYPLDRRLGRSQSQSGCNDKEKNFYPCHKSNPGYTAHSLVTMLTELYNSALLKTQSRYLQIQTRHVSTDPIFVDAFQEQVESNQWTYVSHIYIKSQPKQHTWIFIEKLIKLNQISNLIWNVNQCSRSQLCQGV